MKKRNNFCRIYYSRKNDDFDDLQGSEVRSEHETGRRLLKQGLWECFHIKLEEAEIGRLSKGKPYLKGQTNVFFNISHCKNLVVCAISDHKIGIDVESRNRRVTDVLAKKILGATEWNQYQKSENPSFTLLKFWTLKESYLKYVGTGLIHDMNTLTFSEQKNTKENAYESKKRKVKLSQWQDAEHILSLCTGIQDEIQVTFIEGKPER